MSPYDPDGYFSVGALCRLEEAEIPLMTSLTRVYHKLVSVVLDKSSKQQLYLPTPLEHTKLAMYKWVSGESTYPPTWQSLYDVLRKLNLEELSEQIVEYLNSK